MTRENLLVSIVLLNYNGVHYLNETIPAAINTNFENKEIIVVDNGSTDESLSFLESYPDVKVIKNTVNSYPCGKNIGVQSAKGEYILMLDNDMLITYPNIINELLNYYSNETAFITVTHIDRGEQLTKFFGGFYSFYGLDFNVRKHNKNIIEKYPKLIEIGCPMGNVMFFKKSVWEIIGGYDEIQPFNHDDIDIGPRAWILGYKNYAYTPSILFEHLGKSNASNKKVLNYRFSLQFSGHAMGMFKNYLFINLIYSFPALFIFLTLKALKDAVVFKNPGIVISHCKSILLFVQNLKKTIRKRSEIQRKRKLKSDAFLTIKPPRQKHES